MTSEVARLRLAVVGVIVVSLFAALTARLWYLQVLDTADFQLQAQANRVRLVYETAPRGRILDRQGRVLVDNRVSDVLTLSRVEAQQHPQVVGRVAALLGVPRTEIDRRIKDLRYSPYKPVPLAEQIDEASVVYLREHQEDFPGVENGHLALRTYPNGGVGAHVLGYVGEINDRELDVRRRRGYRLGEDIGKTGAELGFEEHLRGEPAVTKLEVDARGRVLRRLGHRDAKQGDDVQLTLDLDVQRLTEDALARGLEAARGHWDRDGKKYFVAPAGAAVVLDPRDGSVLAMASYPGYDPTAFIDGIHPDEFRALQDPESHYPLNNRAIQGLYAPGSTFKIVTALAALRSGLISSATTIEDTGSVRIGDRTFRNAGRKAWGRVNLPGALAVSSDVYFYKLGSELWNRYDDLDGSGCERKGGRNCAIQRVALDLGLGAKSGIALPSEAHGRVSDPRIRASLHRANPRGWPFGTWHGGDNVNLAIGQGEMVATPLQMAMMLSTVGNGGTLYRPNLAARALDQLGKVTAQILPDVTRKVEIPEHIRQSILSGLRGAVINNRGTAHAAFAGFGAFAVAGKTGTAQVFGKQDTAIFVGMAPVQSPRYVVAVVLEEAGFGGETAAPVARRIFGGLAGEPPGPITLPAVEGVD